VSQRLPQLVDCRIDTVFEVIKRKSGPQKTSKILPSHNFVGALYRRVQSFPRLPRKFDLVAVFP